MKEVTLIHDVQLTTIHKNVADDHLDCFVSLLKNNVREFEEALRTDIGAIDDIRVVDTHVFVRDADAEEDNRRREIRELTERLLKLVSE